MSIVFNANQAKDYFIRLDPITFGTNKQINYNITYRCNQPLLSQSSSGTIKEGYDRFNLQTYYG
jgi:hypothetical protein